MPGANDDAPGRSPVNNRGVLMASHLQRSIPTSGYERRLATYGSECVHRFRPP